MNYFRIPLNLIVVVILLKDFPLKIIFIGCVIFLLIAGISMTILHKLTSHDSKQHVLPIPQHNIKPEADDQATV